MKPRQPVLDRRKFLGSSALASGALLFGPGRAEAQGAPPVLRIETRTIEVNKKAAKVFHVAGPGGRNGILATEGDRFNGTVVNASHEPLQLHWHGQVKAPFDQDRARPGGGSLPIGGSDTFDFELTPGTHWMHSHTLSEQLLLAAPMIAREKNAGDVQDVVVMLHDFSFRSPEEILAGLGGAGVHSSHDAAPSKGAPVASEGSRSGSGAGSRTGSRSAATGAPKGSAAHGHRPGMVHANDVTYDAYLANERTFDDPEVVRVAKGARVRLRIINGATATAFFITTPGMKSACIAVDGNACAPISAASYPLAQGQRVDLVVTIPNSGGAFPVIAGVEGVRFQTGIILATVGASITRRSTSALAARPLIDTAFEALVRASAPLTARAADKAFNLTLGEGDNYRWTINNRIHGEHEPLKVGRGERVEISFANPTGMMHPMHLHGHHFQVVAIGGRRFAGAMRDTVIVPPNLPVTIALDAEHKGQWFLHCHHLYHMATGMMTELHVA